jgi:predicted HAD superfamily Cof-like phosphohydrolase
MIKTPLQMVQEFAVTMGQPLDLKPSDDGFDDSEQLGYDLVLEEWEEFDDARYIEFYEEGPTTDTLKELADLVYVAYGYAARRGWDLDAVLVDVHRNNMLRCIWPDGSVHRNEQGKILKNPDYPKINLEKYV